MTHDERQTPRILILGKLGWLFVFSCLLLSAASYQTYCQTLAVNAVQQELRKLVNEMRDAERKLVEATDLSNDAIQATGERMEALRTTLDDDYDDVIQAYLSVCRQDARSGVTEDPNDSSVAPLDTPSGSSQPIL